MLQEVQLRVVQMWWLLWKVQPRLRVLRLRKVQLLGVRLLQEVQLRGVQMRWLLRKVELRLRVLRLR